MGKQKDDAAGYVPLSRKIFENALWKEPRIYSPFEAWVDIIQSARYEPTEGLAKGHWIKYERGETLGALRYLADKWTWSKNRVDRFLKKLVAESMISCRETPAGTMLLLLQYETYNKRVRQTGQHEKPANKPPHAIPALPHIETGTPNGTAAGQQRDSSGDKVNKDNKEKKEKEENPYAPVVSIGDHRNPTLDEVRVAFIAHSGTIEQADKFFIKNTGLGWMRGKQRIRNFIAFVPDFIDAWNEIEKKDIKTTNFEGRKTPDQYT